MRVIPVTSITIMTEYFLCLSMELLESKRKEVRNFDEDSLILANFPLSGLLVQLSILSEKYSRFI